MNPAYEDNFAAVYAADALTGLAALPEKSVHCVVTSPPYWGLRSYLPSGHPDKEMELGAEPTPELYVERLVEVFRGVWRVLRDDGTLWLNLGDAYAGSWGAQSRGDEYPGRLEGGSVLSARQIEAHPRGSTGTGSLKNTPGLKRKDLIGLPWMVAFALRADGWYLRSDIVWSKPNPMPESVTDRPTKSHEYVFLLTKSPRYFYDKEAVKERGVSGQSDIRKMEEGLERIGGKHKILEDPLARASSTTNMGRKRAVGQPGSRNRRSVWEVATCPYSGSHYATFPPDLAYPCVKAGTSEYGVCTVCLAPWERVVEKTGEFVQQHWAPGTQEKVDIAQGRHGSTSVLNTGHIEKSRTVGWQPTCSCDTETVPATVLDPFMGSGTTAYAARKLGRKSIGFDLDERNVAQIEKRLGLQGVML